MSKRPAFQDWKKVKFGKKEPRVRGEHDFSIRLEATKKDGVQTGETPRPNVPRPPKTESSAARAQTRGGPKTPVSSRESCFSNQTVPARTGNIDAVITVPMGKLLKNTNLVYDAIETSRLEESINRPNENDGIMVVRIKTIKQFDNMVQDLREIEGTVGKALHIYDTPANCRSSRTRSSRLSTSTTARA